MAGLPLWRSELVALVHAHGVVRRCGWCRRHRRFLKGLPEELGHPGPPEEHQRRCVRPPASRCRRRGPPYGPGCGPVCPPVRSGLVQPLCGWHPRWPQAEVQPMHGVQVPLDVRACGHSNLPRVISSCTRGPFLISKRSCGLESGPASHALCGVGLIGGTNNAH